MKTTPEGLARVTKGTERMAERHFKILEKEDVEEEAKKRRTGEGAVEPHKTEDEPDTNDKANRELAVVSAPAPRTKSEDVEMDREEAKEEQEATRRKVEPELPRLGRPSKDRPPATPLDQEKDEQETKRRRIDEMSREEKSIKCFPPLIGKVGQHITHDFTYMSEGGV